MKTKIIATLGPASCTEDVIHKMINAGMDVCRLNFSHGTHDDHLATLEIIKRLNEKFEYNIAVLGDLQGPKIRIGNIKEGKINIPDGGVVKFVTYPADGSDNKFFISYKQFPADVKAGEIVMVDDGKLHFRVTDTNSNDEVTLVAEHGGDIFPRKGVNLPDTAVSIPALTAKDKLDVDFMLNNGFHWIALSFVRSANDIKELREYINSKAEGILPKIIAKIEKPEALKEIDSIINETDGIMVARGDLGVELPIQYVPLLQKSIVKKCLDAGKPVIVATQMLESMIVNPGPTRAEVNDVANSVMDGADACMLSGETSVGSFPAEAVDAMNKIIVHVETFQDIYYKHCIPDNVSSDRYISDSVIYNACNTAQQSGASAIAAFTNSGYTAFRIAAQRPRAVIYIFTNNKILLNTLNLVWGVHVFYYNKNVTTDETIEDIRNILIEAGCIKKGEILINIVSTPVEAKGMSNTMKLVYV